MAFGNDRRELRKGEKFVVTIDEVVHNTILVFLEYRKAKFCGALLNTSNRRGPYGIEERPDNTYYRAYGIDPKKLKEDEIEREKMVAQQQVRLPQTLDIRTTYAQKIELPPARQIYMRRRRSKRKVRMDMINTDLALKIVTSNSGRKLLSHPSTCCCDTCASGGLMKLSDEKKAIKGKRKLIADGRKETGSKQEKNDMAGFKPLSKQAKRIKLDKESVKTNNSKVSSKDNGSKDSAKTGSTSEPIKRSPVIKISYKSPGGKGRILKIPSRLHSPTPNSNDAVTKRNAMHERARKVVNRAKSEHFKYLQEHKGDTDNKFIAPTKATAKPKGLSKRSSTKQTILSLDKNEASKEKPNFLHVSDTSAFTSVESPNQQRKTPKNSPRKNTEAQQIKDDAAKTFNGKKESPNTIRRRHVRSLHPHVLLQPISARKSEDSLSTLSNSTKATVPSQLAVKFKQNIPKEESSEAEDASASVNAVGTSSHRKKTPTSVQASHSISVTRCTTRAGVKWCQGDVVWGKIMGFPWWPGILKKIVIKNAESKIEQIAIVDWFQSKTVSHIPCTELESFSESFDRRFVRKRKGKYRKAIQDAREAEKEMSPEVRKLIMQFET
ncbi:PWWP domain-containing protein 2A-like [Styela clava]